MKIQLLWSCLFFSALPLVAVAAGPGEIYWGISGPTIQSLCEVPFVDEKLECVRLAVGGKFQAAALNACEVPFVSTRLDCLRIIKDRRYAVADARLCGGIPFVEEKLACLKSLGTVTKVEPSVSFRLADAARSRERAWASVRARATSACRDWTYYVIGQPACEWFARGGYFVCGGEIHCTEQRPSH